MQHLFEGFYKGSESCIEYDDGNDGGTEVFIASVPKRMVSVRRSSGKLCPHDRDDGGESVAEIVDRIQHNGNRI